MSPLVHYRVSHLVLPVIVLATVAATLAGCGSREASEPTSEQLGGDVSTVAPEAFEAASVSASGSILVHVPCGMIIPVKKAITTFKEANPDAVIEEEYDNASVLVAKILERGVRPDVFVSPGISEIGRLEQEGLVDPDSKRAVGSFRLVAIVQRDSELTIESPEDLLECETVAIAEPEVNSVGTCAKEALMNLGLWEQIEPKTVQTSEAIKAYQYVMDGKADVGISYRSCPLETNPEKMSESEVRIAYEFEPEAYEKQKIWVAPLNTSENPETAAALVAFLTTPQGLTILADNGMPGTAELQPQDVASDASDGEVGGNGIRSVGPEDAPVQITAYFPDNETHVGTWQFLKGLQSEYGDSVKLEMVDFGSDAGFDRWRADGLDCGAVSVNGKTHWEFEADGEEKTATFRRKMGQDWFDEDLEALVADLVSKAESGEESAA